MKTPDRDIDDCVKFGMFINAREALSYLAAIDAEGYAGELT